MVTAELLTPIKELEPVDDAIAKEIDEAVEKAEEDSKVRDTQKATLYYTIPFPGVRYYSFQGTGAA